MGSVSLNLQPSEGIVVRAAAMIYAAYIGTGRVTDGKEKEWRERAAKEAILLAVCIDNAVRSDDEVG